MTNRKQFIEDLDLVANGKVARINRPAEYTLFAESGSVWFVDIKNDQPAEEIGSVR